MSAEFSFQSSPARPRERERVLVVVVRYSVVVVFVVVVFVVVFRRLSFGIERPLAALLIQRRFPDVVERPHLVLVLYSFLSLFTTQNGGKTNRRRLVRVVVVVVLLFFSLFLSFSVGRSVSMLQR